MGTEENKAVGARLCERRHGWRRSTGVKEAVAATDAALKGQRFEGEELVAEGDVVFARSTTFSPSKTGPRRWPEPSRTTASSMEGSP
jgi:hypothetical protein